ncbi:MAG: isoprenylcysteine carboxylmethyltransferase family protein [Euryarchaeota archaeon]|nr:isoprenylcysteine carboxylmethyltransferase family protein [Euryarchaeota archaeon]
MVSAERSEGEGEYAEGARTVVVPIAPPLGGTGSPVSLLTGSLVLVWVLSEVAIRVYAVARGAPARVPRGPDRGSWVVLVIGIAGIIVLSTVDRANPLLGLPPLGVLYLGDALMGLGIAVRVWAITVLGRFFTTRVMIQKGHQLITKGPYRWVRHPSYTGALTTLIGLSLAYGSLLGTLLALTVGATCFGYRIHVEEKALAEGFGKEYEEYRRHTRRLIPGVY